MEEKWEPIPGYEDLYLASNIGRIKSIFYKRKGREIILKPSLDHRGYPQVILVKGESKVSRKIHKDIHSGVIIKIWDSLTQTEQIGLNAKRVWSACNGKSKYAGGYKWEYL